MRKLITGLVAAGLLAGTAVTGASPAEARWHGGGYHGGWHGGYHHGIGTGGAIGIGLLGLGVGAAIASSDHPRYYDGGGYYAPPPPPPAYYGGYYAPPPPPPAYYGGYYGY